MNKIITTILMFFIVITIKAQAPQAICYQAVATDNDGIELSQQSIKVRASILKNSASGNAEWVEEHLVSTDIFGLFTLPLGKGISTGAGSAANFSDIKWGIDKYFLKVEMDINGGSNFTLMGTTQLLSVPYALYADRSNYADIAVKADTAVYAQNAANATFAQNAMQAQTALDDLDKDATNELQSLSYANGILTIVPGIDGQTDSLNIQDADGDPENELQSLDFNPVNGELKISGSGSVVNVHQGIFNAPGASPYFPQGLLGHYKFLKQSGTSTPNTYVVPAGKTFYVTAMGGSGTTVKLKFKEPNSAIQKILCTYPSCPVFPAGTTLIDCNCTGFEIASSDDVQPVIIDLANPYLVPANKVLFLKSGPEIGANTLKVDGTLTSFYLTNSGTQLITIPGDTNGVTIQHPLDVPNILTGYLLNNQ